MVEQIAALETKIERAERQLSIARARQNKTLRPDERRHLITGTIILEHLERFPTSEFAHTVSGLIDEHVKRCPRNRTLFRWCWTGNGKL
jgi:hypothetical protein